MRLGVDETVIPLPFEISLNPQYLATITTKTPPFNLTLLVPDNATQLDNSVFTYTDDPNCFQDKGETYTNSFERTANQVTLTTTNGSTCITRSLPATTQNPYLEVSLDYQLAATDHDRVETINSPSEAQQQLLETINSLPTANYFSACLIHADSNHCLNNHNTFNNQANNLTLVTSRLTSAPPQLFISLPTIGTQSATLALGSMTMTTYKPLSQTPVDINPAHQPASVTTPIDTITLSKSLSPESYYFNPRLDALRVYNQPCSEGDEYRAVKQNQSDTTLLYTHNCSSGAYNILPFNSNHLYLWHTDYHLYSGKFPTFSLASSDNTYLQRYLSWDQGYPNITGFRNLQLADPPASISQNYSKYINTQLNQSTYQPTSALVYPQAGLNETGTRSWTIAQNSQNQGLVGISNLNITQLPTDWQNMSISQSSAQTTFRSATVNQVKSVLPSLWRIDLVVDQLSKFNLENEPTPNTDQVFLHFSQAYDDKWQLYQTNNPVLALLGVGKVKADHVKVNGLTNGWLFTPSQNQATYYALYTPERLAIIGWIITLSTLAYLSIRNFTKPKLKRVRNHDTR